ncbi:hypothetical protein AB0280_17610 [Pseudarthrobacter sp902506025]|uniref:hypothetical protein n=1 Tax=Pseudarthrobacter sp. 902506025 TaxID=3155291 RepID=UPI003450C1AD
MFKSFIELWIAIQQLLVQIQTIKGEFPGVDAVIIRKSLEVYKQTLLVGLTDDDITTRLRAYASGKIDVDSLKEVIIGN